MKVIQLPFCFYPDPVGGTEVYVESLAQCLQSQGISVGIAIPGREDKHSTRDGLDVWRLKSTQSAIDLDDLYGEGDVIFAQSFDRLLEEEKPDLIHLHAYTHAHSVRLVDAAHLRKIPVVFTYHTPTVSCMRGTLMRWGKSVCDGILRVGTCTRCTLQGHGLPRPIADLVGLTPVLAGRAVANAGLSGRVWTALRMHQLVSSQNESVRQLLNSVDHVVAVCCWVEELLLSNGLSSEKVFLSRQGVRSGTRTDPPQRPHDSSEPIRVVCAGRLEPIKGVHLLIQAIRSAPQLRVQLDLYGIVQGKESAAYLKSLKNLAAQDPRITFCESVEHIQWRSCLREYDLLAVPSIWMESGPLVVLEAFAAGLPVIGSNLGGLAELVKPGVNGLLVEDPFSPQCWRQSLECLEQDRDLLEKLRSGVEPPKTMEQAAGEMQKLYEQLVSKGPAA